MKIIELKFHLSFKDKEKNKKKKFIEDTKKTSMYQSVLDKFLDADLIDVQPKKKKD